MELLEAIRKGAGMVLWKREARLHAQDSMRVRANAHTCAHIYKRAFELRKLHN